MCDVNMTLARDTDQKVYREFTFYRTYRKSFIDTIRCFPREGDYIHSFDIRFAKKYSAEYTKEFSALVDRRALLHTFFLRFHNWNESSTFVFDFRQSAGAFAKLENLVVCHTKITGVKHILPQLRHVTLIDNDIDIFPVEYLAHNLLTLELRGTSFIEPVDLSRFDHLQRVTLCDNNLKECPRLSDSLSLTYLDISCNRISRVVTLPDSLHELIINDNLIDYIDRFPDLVVCVNMWDNPLKRLPANLLTCRYLSYIHMHNTEVVLNIMELRFLERCRNRLQHSRSVYEDEQNTHNSAVQSSLLLSCSNLFRDAASNNRFTTTGDKHVDGIISNNLRLPDKHCTLGVSYAEIFHKVWDRIATEQEPRRSELIRRLREETLESEGVCFMGKITRLVNVLSGFYTDINIGVGDSDQIYARIIAHRARHAGFIRFAELEKEIAEVVGAEKAREWMHSIKDYEQYQEMAAPP